MSLLQSVFGRTPRRSDDGRQRWLLVFNCQALGLGNCLNLLGQGIHVEAMDTHGFRRQSRTLLRELPRYDRILVAPQVEESLGLDLGDDPRVWRVPTISFNAYHPDLCYLSSGGAPLKGALEDYHSLIAFAAFRSGLGVEQTVALYRRDTFEQLGYLDLWERARNSLLRRFKACGFDLGPAFLQWSRRGPFMHSINHPRIDCLRDLARTILVRAGIEVPDTDVLPHDNLANGPVFPVYKEIGARLGLPGSHHFKPGGRYRLLGLDEFVAASFRCYAAERAPEVRPDYAPMLEMAMPIIGAMR